MFDFIRHKYETFMSMRAVRKWQKRTDAAGYKEYTVSRRYDVNELFIDLHWFIYPANGEHHIESIYQRCHTRHAREMLHMVERHQLPHLLKKLRNERK